MLSKRTAWRVFGLALALSLLAMLASNNCREMLKFTTIQPSPHRRISAVDSYIEAILEDTNTRNSSIARFIAKNIPSTTVTHSSRLPAKHTNSAPHHKTRNDNSTHEYDRKVFLMDAYLVDDQLIRITTIRKCKSKTRLTLHLRFNITTFSIPSNSQPIQSCPWFFARKCDFVGYFTHVNLPKVIMPPLMSEAMPDAFISSAEDKKSTRYPLRLRDVRTKKTNRRHKLAVCLQPIFLLADWTILVQFFETWIVQGATKFYVYVHSMAPEVDALLRVYEADHNVDVERVHWAPLPVRNDVSPTDDPNFYIYRTEVVTAVNDCVLRSRGHAKYVVSSDLDEIIVPFHNRSLLDLVHSLKMASPNAGAFVFLSSYAMFEVSNV
ncbi:unnamed protein product [Toxocara canis]|uniref:Glycosyltransferase family 92 protein n=1 Tax=Toxocara canis TaxID=6265 RepID=A0A183UG47_TOXCA|nr:unnamed protein product [Toxocara canis]